MRLLHEKASPRELRILKTWVFGIWLAYIALLPLYQASYFPISLFQPAGPIFKIIPQLLHPYLLTPAFLTGLQIITLISLTLVVFNRLPKPAAITSCILLTLHQGLIRGFGRIHHAEIVLLYGAYLLTLFTLADEHLLRNPRKNTQVQVNLNSIPFVSILGFFLLTYSFTGIYRITHGGFELLFSDGLIYSIVLHSFRPLTPFDYNLHHIPFVYPFVKEILKAGFFMITFLEIFAPLCLIMRWFRYIFIAVMIPFHILTAAFMHLFFWETLLLCALLFDWSRIREKSANAHG